MTLKSFPYKWTCLVGALLLASTLWSAMMLDGIGFLLSAIFALCFFVSVVASLGIVALDRSKESLYRILINVSILLLFFPTGRLGSYLGERLFLMHLNRFQEVTSLLIEKAASNRGQGDFTAEERLPSTYSDLHVLDFALIDSKRGNITVRYLSRDSSALGHRGYMYRSDDDPTGCRNGSPGLWCKRVALRWFFFTD